MPTEAELNELQSRYDGLNVTLGERNTRVSELEAERGQFVTQIAELQEGEKAQRVEIGILLAEFIDSEVRKLVTLESQQDLVIEMVIDSQPQSRAEAKAALDKVLERPSVQKALKATIATEMGPDQTIPRSTNGATSHTYLDEKPKSPAIVVQRATQEGS